MPEYILFILLLLFFVVAVVIIYYAWRIFLTGLTVKSKTKK